MQWKENHNLCFCSFKRNPTKTTEWIRDRPDLEDSPCPCYFCVIAVDPKVFEQEWDIKISDIPDIYCLECKLPRKSEHECIQKACINHCKKL